MTTLEFLNARPLDQCGIYFNGNLSVYTGHHRAVHGIDFWEIEMLEGDDYESCYMINQSPYDGYGEMR